MSRAIRTLYRLFLRQVAALEKNGLIIDMQMPMDKEAWLRNGGGHGWAPETHAYMKESLESLLPWLAKSNTYLGSFTPGELRDCIRSEFRQPSSPPSSSADLMDRAFTSLRVLGEQLHMAECSSTAITDGVRIDVCTAFVGSDSDLNPTYKGGENNESRPNKLYFTYRIRVSNLGERTVQLLSRHWIIKDPDGKVIAEVAKGAKGVVGCTPILKPKTCFQYYSGTDLRKAGGTMEGSFGMAVLSTQGVPESYFDAEIGQFKFARPEGEKYREGK